MAFRYYWDGDLFEALLRYRMLPFLADTFQGDAPGPATGDVAGLTEPRLAHVPLVPINHSTGDPIK